MAGEGDSPASYFELRGLRNQGGQAAYSPSPNSVSPPPNSVSQMPSLPPQPRAVEY